MEKKSVGHSIMGQENPLAAVKWSDTDMKAALVIMAAGMGSRYGGEKQTDGIGPLRGGHYGILGV